MLRAGMIRKLAAGLYTWLPLGLRVLRKVERIVREEMERAGALELLMPAVQPAELWQESGRWEQYGPELLRLQGSPRARILLRPDPRRSHHRSGAQRDRSYRQLPINFYQIQTKFRDEIRPRFGVMRAREFLMKDAYSFHLDEASLERDLPGRCTSPTAASSSAAGWISGRWRRTPAASAASASHEFHVLADSGEDAIVFSNGSDYAANVELAAALAPPDERPPRARNCRPVDTPGPAQHRGLVRRCSTCPSSACVKTLLVRRQRGASVVALVLRGDHELNEIKADKLPAGGRAAAHGQRRGDSSRRRLRRRLDRPGRPANADHRRPCRRWRLADFVCGANQDGQHLSGVNWERDLPAAAGRRSAQVLAPATPARTARAG